VSCRAFRAVPVLEHPLDCLFMRLA
jgi:hypothetical protein